MEVAKEQQETAVLVAVPYGPSDYTPRLLDTGPIDVIPTGRGSRRSRRPGNTKKGPGPNKGLDCHGRIQRRLYECLIGTLGPAYGTPRRCYHQRRPHPLSAGARGCDRSVTS